MSEDGSVIDVEWQQGQTSPVAGHNGFNIVSIDSRSVSLRLPPGQACTPNEEKGVYCTNDANVIQLKLSFAESIAQPEADRTATTQLLADSDVDDGQMRQGRMASLASGSQQLSPDQLEAISERQQMRTDRLGRQPAPRIPEDEIPEGMRVVRTPFGDRLIPDF